MSEITKTKMSANNEDGMGKRFMRSLLSKGLGLIFRVFPPEMIIMMAKDGVAKLISSVAQSSQTLLSNYNQDVLAKREAGDGEALLAKRVLNMVYVDYDDNGKPRANVATAYLLENNQFKVDTVQKFTNAEKLIEQKANEFIGPDKNQLNIKLANMMLPGATKQEIEEELSDQEIEDELEQLGPPK